jgi:hypothetical protein
MFALFAKWHKRRDFGSFVGLGLDSKFTIYEPNPLLHADQAETALLESLVEVKTVSSVLDTESYSLGAAR